MEEGFPWTRRGGGAAKDIKGYVRRRRDAVRSIVRGLINDTRGPDSLAEVLHEELKASNEDNTLARGGGSCTWAGGGRQL